MLIGANAIASIIAVASRCQKVRYVVPCLDVMEHVSIKDRLLAECPTKVQAYVKRLTHLFAAKPPIRYP